MEVSLPLDNHGKRLWLYPSIVKGIYYRWRSILSYFYLAFFFMGPFLRIQGEPLLMLNFLDRKFIILGHVFWPQDIFLFTLASLIFIICIILFTIAFGRIFCGWICPQTIFMEMVFRKIEIWIEGDAHQRKKLDEGPWNRQKILKKGLKFSLFLILSFLIANTFLAYIIGSEDLIKIISEPISEHWSGFISISLFTLLFFTVYAQARELVCILICPYGRLQGVMLDKNSLVVAYNTNRGEPRGKLIKNPLPTETRGDCVDCGLCVAVCPTGIDIRKGTQLECINCTECIDACDQVMEKIHKPKNLIGYFSSNMIQNQEKPGFTMRMKAYSLVILTLIGILLYFIFSLKDLDMTVLRTSGMTYFETDHKIVNVYSVEIINKTNRDQTISIIPENPNIHLKYIQAPGLLKKNGSVKAVIFLMIPPKLISDINMDVELNLFGNQKFIQKVSTSFFSPNKD